MRFKASFSLYRRKVGGGKAVYYYQCYDSNGRRLCGHSTGQSTKTAAREYCITLCKENRLVRTKYQRIPTFKEFADGFWDEEKSVYLKYLKSRKKISKKYPYMGRMTTDKHLLPEFGDLRLDVITDRMVDSWLLTYPARGLSGSTGNGALKFFSTMLSWAVKEGLIEINPCKKVKLLREEVKHRELLDVNECAKLFGDEWEKYWGKYIYCLMNKVAACTGMRISEVIGLKGMYVGDRQIVVNGQYGIFGYTDTKNHKPRTVPVTRKIIEELTELKKINGDEFLFSKDGGKTPVSKEAVTAAFKKAMTKLGIDRAEQKRRGLTFHSWRHFLNTSLLLADIADVKVQEIVGHLSGKETRRYTQIKTSDLHEITTVQEKLITAPKGKKASGSTAPKKREKKVS